MNAIAISKTLSANDVGETGGHQAGILIPKESEVLEFMPRLDSHELNPRIAIPITDVDSGMHWIFNYIYYNNKVVARGTRNEYRLTGMTEYLRSVGATTGDTLVFTKNRGGEYTVKLVPRADAPALSDAGVLVLKGGWKVIPS